MGALYGRDLSFYVAYLAEAWIEILYATSTLTPAFVASLAEAWIEILNRIIIYAVSRVASLAEAWIEMQVPRKRSIGSFHT